MHCYAADALALCLIVCCCTVAVTEPLSSAPIQQDATDQLQFVTIGSVGGCPVSLFYPTSTNGSAYLSPALCLADDPSPDSLMASACTGFDLALNITYLDIPLRSTSDPVVLAQAKDAFRHHLENRTLAFLRRVQTGLKIKTPRSIHATPTVMKLELEPGLRPDAGGFIRMACSSYSCGELRSSAHADELWDAVEQTEVELELAPLSSSGLWQQPITMKQRVHVANRGRILTASHASSPQVLSAPSCTAFNLHRQLLTPDESCRVTVLQRTDRKGHYVMEPMLCYHGNFTEQGGVVRLTLSVRSSRVRDSVTRALSHLSPLSVTFMSMVGAELRVSESLLPRTGWSFETLRLSVDGDSAELRVRCGSADSCRLLRSILLLSPTDLLSHVQFSVESQVESLSCSHLSVITATVMKTDGDCKIGTVPYNPLASYHLLTNGHLCIRPEFVESLPAPSAEACALVCTRQSRCQAFSVENGYCRWFMFDKCSKSVRDCSCSRRGQVFVKQQPGLQPGALCPSGYGDDVCGVKYKLYRENATWTESRRKCESAGGLVIMADVVDATEMDHVEFLYSKYSSGSDFWLGGFQAPGSPEPAGGWSWVACDLPVDSSLWGSGQPSNDKGGRENAIGKWHPLSKLNDFTDYAEIGGLCECTSPFD